jgi:hypothetical protein
MRRILLVLVVALLMAAVAAPSAMAAKPQQFCAEVHTQPSPCFTTAAECHQYARANPDLASGKCIKQ